MKLFRNIAKAVLAVSMLSVMVACEEEAVYTPAQDLTNAQVYFSNTTAKDVKLTMEDTELNVAICRANTIGNLDVQLVVSGTELMTAPSSVKFADGDSVANIKVTFDPQAIGYDNPQTLNIALADSTMGTPYGESVFSLTAMIPSPWTSLGKATVVDDIMTVGWGIPFTPFPVEIQENDLTPGLYRLVNPWTSSYPWNEPGDYDDSKNYYLEIHAEDPDAVWFGRTEMGLDWGYGMISTWSIADYYVQNGTDPELVKEKGFYGTLKDGEITFPVQGILFNMPQHPQGDNWYLANGSGMFSILLPGYVKADYSAEVKYAGIFTATDESVYAVANLTLGADAKDVKAIVMTQADDAAAVADALAAGELEGTPVQAGRIEVPFNAEELGSEKLQVIVAVIVDGAVKNVVTSGFEYYGGGSNPWKSLGMGTYTETLVSTMFTGYEPVTYEVEILENTENPGLFRLMNAYANGTFPNADNDCAAEGTYLEVNACDPDGVYVPMQSLGFDWGMGEMAFISEGARYLEQYDIETVKNAGLLGTLKDGIITLANIERETSNGVAYYQGIMYMGNSGYYAGIQDGFRVTLPGAATEAPKYARSQFVKNLERTFIGKKFAPVVNKRLFKRMAQPVF